MLRIRIRCKSRTTNSNSDDNYTSSELRLRTPRALKLPGGNGEEEHAAVGPISDDGPLMPLSRVRLPNYPASHVVSNFIPRPNRPGCGSIPAEIILSVSPQRHNSHTVGTNHSLAREIMHI